MRKIINFNNGWLFSGEQLNLGASDDQFIEITLPHSNQIFPHHNNDSNHYQFISHYRKHFNFQSESENEFVFLDFDGVMLACKVYLNGILLTEHLGGYAPFSVDITSALNHGENILSVLVDSNEREDIPPFGDLVDYLTYGGIYRDVNLRIVHPLHICNIFVQTINILDRPQVKCLVNLSRINPGLMIKAVLFDQKHLPIAERKSVIQSDTIELLFDQLPDITLWDIDDPTLYTIAISLYHEESLIDSVTERFGFRSAEFRPDGGFYLNGVRLNLFGLNRHQTYPYIGAAAPERLQCQDAEILKNELGCNIVRTSHYPQSPHFLNRCDEIGLLVFEEITGWHHIGDSQWKEISLTELETIIERDRNHPSIILWGVRINESADDDSFYSQTNALAHRMDTTRQTGGVRCFMGSSLLEDVYTFNDFSMAITKPSHKPHLITEFAGHMFHTKIWDHEQRLVDHALLHAKIHNLQIQNTDIAGAIGWCAFDYATHVEFGSGDRICYHGVMDIFRLPKWAAYFYKSQQSPKKQIVLQPATYWTMGERSGCADSPLTVFSNCDEVEIIVGENNLGIYKPDYQTFPNLLHPPFAIEGLKDYGNWGQGKFYDLRLIGYINSTQVIEKIIPADRLPKNLDLQLYSDTLNANGYDMTRLAFRIIDDHGNPLPFVSTIIKFEVEGPANLIGENPYPMFGGQAAVYIKSRHDKGMVTIHASAANLPPATISLEIR
jgi:beta-galactosidase